MIWNNSELSVLQMSHDMAIFLVDCCQFGPSWMFGLKLSLWPVPTWLAVQRNKAVFFLTLYDSISYMKYFWTDCITPQPCHIHFCCWLLPIWPKLDFYNINYMIHFQTLYITPHPALVYFNPSKKRLLKLQSPIHKMYTLY